MLERPATDSLNARENIQPLLMGTERILLDGVKGESPREAMIRTWVDIPPVGEGTGAKLCEANDVLVVHVPGSGARIVGMIADSQPRERRRSRCVNALPKTIQEIGKRTQIATLTVLKGRII